MMANNQKYQVGNASLPPIQYRLKRECLEEEQCRCEHTNRMYLFVALRRPFSFFLEMFQDLVPLMLMLLRTSWLLRNYSTTEQPNPPFPKRRIPFSFPKKMCIGSITTCISTNSIIIVLLRSRRFFLLLFFSLFLKQHFLCRSQAAVSERLEDSSGAFPIKDENKEIEQQQRCSSTWSLEESPWVFFLPPCCFFSSFFSFLYFQHDLFVGSVSRNDSRVRYSYILLGLEMNPLLSLSVAGGERESAGTGEVTAADAGRSLGTCFVGAFRQQG